MAVAAEIEDSYFLSPLQQGMLFESLAGQPGVNVEQIVCTLPERIEVSQLKRAWNRVLKLHPVLRTSFEWGSLDQPLQQVHRSLQLPFTEYDWRGLSTAQQAEQRQTFLNCDRQQGFKLTEAPLFRLALVRLGETEYQLFWTFHHILLDGRSLTLLLQEVFALYAAFCRGQDLPIAPACPAYRQHIDWLQQQDVAAAKPFWQQLLAGFNTPTPLPLTARPLPDCPGWSEASIRLSVTLTTTLQAFAHQHDLTPNTLIQAAWGLLLSRYSGQADVVFGATRACRYSGLPGAESMVGLLINTLPVRVQVPPAGSLLPWLTELRSQHLKVRAYEQTPLITVQTWSEVPPGKRLFESIVIFENYLLNTKLRQQGGDWQDRAVQQFDQPSYPLVLVAGLDAELQLKILYNPSQFEPEAIAQLLANLQTLLAGMVANPDQPIATLPILSPTERQQLLTAEWNATDVAYPDHLCLHHLFEAQVIRQPEAIAVACAGQSLDYQQLNQQANQVAHALQQLGVGPEMPVGICLERSLAMVVGLLGILKAGGAYLPLDPAYPAARLAHIVSDSQVAIVLTQESLLPCLPAGQITTLCLDQYQLQTELANQSIENPTGLVTARNLAYMIYTSGSTGLPKGVLIEHRGAVNTILDINRRFQVGAGDRGLAVCSLNFDLSVFDIFGLLAAGGQIVLPQPTRLPDLKDWLSLMQQEQITLWNSAPPVLQMVADYLVDCGLSLPASLRLILLSGDWIPVSLPGLVRQLKPAASPVQVISLGGATEASIWSIAYPIETIDPGWKSIPYGRPLANQQFYILDSRANLVPLGAIGELYIGGLGAARGYHNRPDLNASKFKPDPFRPSGGQLYRTGDLGRYLPDGNIEFLGRIDDQVKIRGFRVELAEIETVISQHPQIRQCIVLLREDEPGDQRLVAYLVAAEAAATSELHQFLQRRLPEYMIPSSFIWLTTLPLTPNGKINRQALPLPGLLDRVPTETAAVAARSPLEQELTQIWQDVLGIEPIGVKDNFFALGGHSLLAVQMLTQIESRFGKCLPITALLHSATIEALAEVILNAQAADIGSNLVVLNQGGNKPPLFCIYGILFYQALANHLHPEQPVYGVYLQEEVELLKAGNIEAFMTKFSNLAVVATRCLELIRRLQPQGPYYLAGASLGGAIAYEMAQQLQASGEQVALVAMIDTYNPHCDHRKPWLEHLQTHAELLAKHKLTYIWQKMLLQRQKLQLHLLSRLSSPQPFGNPNIWQTPYLRNMVQTVIGTTGVDIRRQVHQQMLRSYLPQPYPGQVLLFRATERDAFENSESDLGWGELLDQNLHIFDVPGDHLGILQPPNVQALAEQLQAYLP